MKLGVVDTSALIRLFVPDGPMPAGFESFVELAWRAETILVAPELVLAEAGQVLHKKERAGLISRNDCDEILEAILDLPLEVVGHRDLLSTAVKLARSNGITVYDAMFVALAVTRGGVLFTADEDLQRSLEPPV